MTRCLHASFQSCGIRSEPRLEHKVLVIEVKVHSGIVLAGCLVDIDIQSVGSLHLQGCLHASLREHRDRGVVPVDSLFESSAYLRQLRLLCLLLLCVVIARQPPCRMVARHGKLRMLLLDKEIVERLLLWELIAKSHSLVVYTEAYDDVAVGGRLVEVHLQLVVVVAYLRPFAPHGSPCLVERR